MLIGTKLFSLLSTMRVGGQHFINFNFENELSLLVIINEKYILKVT
jgi:hypothetical protein